MAPGTCMPAHALFLGLVPGRIGDDDKKLASAADRARGLPQLIDRGLLSQESSIAPFGDGNSTDGGQNISPPTRSPSYMLLLIFGSLLTFFFSRDGAGSRAPHRGRKRTIP